MGKSGAMKGSKVVGTKTIKAAGTSQRRKSVKAVVGAKGATKGSAKGAAMVGAKAKAGKGATIAAAGKGAAMAAKAGKL